MNVNMVVIIHESNEESNDLFDELLDLWAKERVARDSARWYVFFFFRFFLLNIECRQWIVCMHDLSTGHE